MVDTIQHMIWKETCAKLGSRFGIGLGTIQHFQSTHL